MKTRYLTLLDIHGYQLNTLYDTLRGLLPFLIPASLWSGPQALGGLRGPQQSGLRECTVLQRFSRFRKRDEEEEVAAGERPDAPLDPPSVVFCGHLLAIFLWSEFAEASRI